MDFKEYLKNSRSKIKIHLQEYCKKRVNDNIPILFKEQKFIEELSDFVTRGKLLRGSLFLFTIESLGKKIENEHLDTACAIELMHSALLIQDDIIDNDYERRGARTVFAKFEDEGNRINAFNAYHYGISSGIVVADIAFFFAMDLLSNFGSKYLSTLLKYYSNEVCLVALAEGADSIFGQTKREPTRDEILDLYRYKTARYTFSLPFEMGVIATGELESTKLVLGRLGILVGVIFQLKDDEIGLFGDAKVIGKPVGSDIRENKKTMIRYFLYKSADDKDRKILDKCFGKSQASAHEIKTVREIYKKYEIQKIIDREISLIMVEVWKLFEEVPFDKNYKNILKGLLEFNISRVA